jgi:AraC-like DNA-binding protein
MQTIQTIKLNEHFPEVREFSHSKTNSAKPFTPRFEDKLWTSILYIERGNFRIQYETGEILHARGGSFYYHPPLAIKYQTYDKTITPYSMYHLAVDLSLPDISIFPTHKSGLELIKELPGKPFIRKAPSLLISSFKKIITEYNEHTPGYLLQIENSICQILISAMRSGLEQEQQRNRAKKFIDIVDSFLADNETFMGPVEVLFDQMNVSRSRGYDIFHQSFGISPKEYVLRKKVNIAKLMLTEGKSITTIAYDLGFSSSQNFATVFKRLTCLTPTKYKKKQFLV